MNRTLLFSLLALATLDAGAEDTGYLPTLKSAHERLGLLEAERQDYRKLKPNLPPQLEDERLRLLGQLLTEDPVWALSEQIQADISALVATHPQSPSDVATIEAVKELLALTAGFEERATTRAQAELFATTLRQFVLRRDVAGAGRWANSQ